MLSIVAHEIVLSSLTETTQVTTNSFALVNPFFKGGAISPVEACRGTTLQLQIAGADDLRGLRMFGSHVAGVGWQADLR